MTPMTIQPSSGHARVRWPIPQELQTPQGPFPISALLLHTLTAPPFCAHRPLRQDPTAAGSSFPFPKVPVKAVQLSKEKSPRDSRTFP